MRLMYAMSDPMQEGLAPRLWLHFTNPVQILRSLT